MHDLPVTAHLFENQRNGHIRWPSAVAAFTNRSCAGYYIPVTIKTGNSGIAVNTNYHVFARHDYLGIRIQFTANLRASDLTIHVGDIVSLAKSPGDKHPIVSHQAGLLFQIGGFGRKVHIDYGPDVIGIIRRSDR